MYGPIKIYETESSRNRVLVEYLYEIAFIHAWGMSYLADRPISPIAEVREALMGFQVGDIGAPADFSQNERVQLMGQCTDLNAIALTGATIRAHLTWKR